MFNFTTLRAAIHGVPHIDLVTPDDVRRAEGASTKMLVAMAATGRPVYPGTVPGAVRDRRRAANKAARAARRVHRVRAGR